MSDQVLKDLKSGKGQRTTYAVALEQKLVELSKYPSAGIAGDVQVDVNGIPRFVPEAIMGQIRGLKHDLANAQTVQSIIDDTKSEIYRLRSENQELRNRIADHHGRKGLLLDGSNCPACKDT